MEPVAPQHETLCSLQLIARRRAGRRKALNMLLAIINFLQAWRRYNASLNELYQLGDRELADIGITRSDIPRIAWDSANR
jgi:uncharacterized protein YjiS (DUF1127 family)